MPFASSSTIERPRVQQSLAGCGRRMRTLAHTGSVPFLFGQLGGGLKEGAQAGRFSRREHVGCEHLGR